MMLIVNFGQVVDLEAGGEFAHQFTVQMPDGRRASITTNERTVQQLIQLIGETQHSYEPAPAHPGSNGQSAYAHELQQELMQQAGAYEVDEEPEGVEFGGDYDPGEEGAVERAPVMGTIAEERVAAVPQRGGLGQGAAAPAPQQPPQRQPPQQRRPNLDADGFLVPPRAKTVQADEAGYPVVSRSAQQSVGHLGAYAEDDDDGTQI